MALTTGVMQYSNPSTIFQENNLNLLKEIKWLVIIILVVVILIFITVIIYMAIGVGRVSSKGGKFSHNPQDKVLPPRKYHRRNTDLLSEEDLDALEEVSETVRHKLAR